MPPNLLRLVFRLRLLVVSFFTVLITALRKKAIFSSARRLLLRE